MHIKIPSSKNTLQLAFLALIGLLVSSCGSYQSVSDSDGIYTSDTTEVAVEEEETTTKSNYYKQYFNTKSQELDDIPVEEDLVFTDIESYTTTETVDENGNIVIEEPSYEEEQYGAWGSNSDNLTVNIYNTGGWGGFYGGLGWYRPWWRWGYGYLPYWGGYYGGWGIGWGGFYNPWYCPPFYGGYYNPYYGGYYGGYGYATSYNRGRSNHNYLRGNSLRRGRSSVASRNSYSRSEIARRSSRTYVGRDARTSVNRNTARTSKTRTNRSTNTRPNTRSTRPNTRTTRPSTSRPNTRSTRPNSRSSRPSYSRPSSSRSSGSRGGGSRSGGSRRGRG